MIHLNDKKEFVIFQKPHSDISYIGIGEWKKKNQNQINYEQTKYDHRVEI